MSFNSFGRLLRVTTWGESHGPAIGAVVDGCPPGLNLLETDIQPWLDKRRPGSSRFTTQRRESDQVRILSGTFEGRTTGTPISLVIENEDQRSKDYTDVAEAYRPGHADYTYDAKYGFRDWRGGGRSSARETAARVAAAAVARLIIPEVTIRAYLVELGGDAIDRDAFDRRSHRRQRFQLPGSRGSGALGAEGGRGAQGRLLARRDCRMRRRGRAAGMGRAGLREARCRTRCGDDVDQRRQGVEIGDGFAAARLRGEDNADADAGRAHLPV